MFKKILFVCVGNICRSPTAEYWARNELKKRGISDVSVTSAGLQAMKLLPIAHEAKLVLDRYGVDASTHCAKQIIIRDVMDAEIILTMENWQTEKLLLTFPSCRGKIFCFGKWSDEEISDPYRKTQEYFERMFELIKICWNDWQSRLWQG